MTEAAAKHRIDLTDQKSPVKGDYGTLKTIAVRWSDLDPLGHVNNVEYLRYFEIALLRFLADAGLDWVNDEIAPMAVETLCRYQRPLVLSSNVEAGIRVRAMGRSSVTYEFALFTSDEDAPSAYGYSTQVFTDRRTGASTEIPDHIRRHFQGQMRGPHD